MFCCHRLYVHAYTAPKVHQYYCHDTEVSALLLGNYHNGAIRGLIEFRSLLGVHLLSR